MKEYIAEPADTSSKYEGLRDLWQRLFGDEPAFVDHVYRVFGEDGLPGGGPASPDADISGYVIRSDEDKVISALTCYRCGTLHAPGDRDDGKPVYVSYAVGTDPAYRGLGLAGELTSHVRQLVTEDLGGISLVSPAEESLIAFYRDLGYRESCFAAEDEAPAEDPDDWDPGSSGMNSEDTRVWGLGDDGTPGFIEDDDAYPAETELTVEEADVITYNKYRESFLTDTAHVSLSEPMLELVRSVSLNGNGMLVINGGDAICVVSEAEGSETEDKGRGQLILNELIVNPELMALSEEIGEEIASGIAGYYGAEKIIYRTPALSSRDRRSGGREDDASGRCQSMSAGTECEAFYFGFPVE